MSTSEARYVRWRTTALVVWSAIGILALVSVALFALGRISAALVPFIIAFIFAFLLNTPVKMLVNRGMSRGAAVALCLVTALLVFGSGVMFLVPPVARQIVAFANETPRYLADGEAFITSLQARVSNIAFPGWLAGMVQTATAQLSQLAVRVGNGVAGALVSAGSGVASALLDIVLALVISFWALKDLPKMRKELAVLAGPRYEADVEHLVGTVTRVLGGYLKGQTIASLVTGTIATIGLAIIGIPYALVLGVITFIFNFVPYVGPFSAGLIAAMVGLFKGPLYALLAIAVVVVAQNFTDNVITPRVMSEQVDLHPILVIFSLLVGGTLFGIPGLLFAIPVAATMKGLFVYYYEQRTSRQLSSEDGALFRAASYGPDEQSDESCAPQDSGASQTDEH